jgi:hypothetical protein
MPVFETLIKAQNGAVSVIGFMPLRDGGGGYRPGAGRRGRHADRIHASLRLRARPALDYPNGWKRVQAVAGPDKVVLRTCVPGSRIPAPRRLQGCRWQDRLIRT